MEGKNIGGGDAEERERARRRGRAYMCLHCFYKGGKKIVDVRGRIEDHILREHRTYEEVPFYCSLCYFRCLKREQLIHHVTAYKRHVTFARKANVSDHTEFLKQNLTPRLITPMDYYMYSTEESIQHFMTISRAAEANRMELREAVKQCLPAELMGNTTETVSFNFNNVPNYIPTPICAPQSTSVISETTGSDSLDTTAVYVPYSDPFFMDQPVKAIRTDKKVDLNSINFNADNRVVTVGNMFKSVDSELSEVNDVVGEMVNQSGDISIANESGTIGEEVTERKEIRQVVNVAVDEEGAEGEEEVEDLTGQLMGEFEEDGNKGVKRKFDGEDESKIKKRNVAEAACERSLLTIMGRLVEATEKNVHAIGRLEELVVENTVIMSKLADSVTRLRRSLDDRYDQENRREENRQADERRREEDRRREERDEGRRRERERRHEEEKRKEERRKENKEKEERKENQEDEKENNVRPKSVLGKSYRWDRIQRM